MSPAIIIPTYNERENLPLLISEIRAYVPEAHLFVVDDNSPDGTGQVADALARELPALNVIHRPRKLGLGTAYIAGMRAALTQALDPIVTLDADFSHHPRYLPDLLTASQTGDLVVGSRYVRGGGTLGCSLPRRVLSHGANLFARTMLGLHATDCTAGFRAYRARVLASMDLDHIFSNGYSFLIEMIYKVQHAGWRIAEIPIIFEDRQQGRSKISRQEIYRAAYTVLRLRWENGRLGETRGNSGELGETRGNSGELGGTRGNV